MRLSALAAVLIIGCTNLPAFDEGVCGNNVLDEGEDCDGATEEGRACGEDGTENACFYTCEGEAQCLEGWVCGTDQRCRRPSSKFEAPYSPWRFPVDSFAVGDVDGDGFADLIGNSFSTVTVRYGAADASFSDELDVFIPSPEGRLSFDDLDGDSRTDVVVPIPGGLFALLGSADRTLTPVANALPLPIPDGVAFRLFPILTTVAVFGHEVLAVITDGTGTFLATISDSPPIPLPGTHELDDLQRLATGKLAPGLPIREAAVMSFRGESEVYVIRTQGDADGIGPPSAIAGIDTVSLGAAKVAGEPILADADGDGDLDIAVPVHTADVYGVSIAWNNNGAPASPAQFVELTYDDGDGTQGTGLPLAAGDFNGDGIADWVTSFGAFVTYVPPFQTNPPNNLPIFLPTGSAPTSESVLWEDAAIIDINQDERLDFVSSNSKEELLAIYLNAGTTPIQLFNRVAVATNVPPRMLRVGEYDGDFFQDLAFVETDPLGVEQDKLRVLFGAKNLVDAEIAEMARVDRVETLEPAFFLLGETIDAVLDLVLSSSAKGDGDGIPLHHVAVLAGSSTRRMLAPYIFDKATPRGALIGDFDGLGDRDVAAVTVPAVGSDLNGPAALGPQIQLLSGVNGGSFVSTENPVTVAPDDFTVPCAVWAAGDLNQNGLDEVVGFDNSSKCPRDHRDEPPRLVVAKMGGEGLEAEYYAVPDDTLRNVSRVQLFDADNDGDLDLVALFRGVFDSSGVEVLSGDGVVVYWNSGEDFVTAVSSPVDGADRFLSSVAPIDLDTDLMPELVVLRDDGVFRAAINPDDKQYQSPQLILDNAGFERFEVGDVNGDGLIDLAFVVGGQVDVYLQQPDEPLGTVAARQAREND
jgi:hypothetical protein